MELIEAQPQNQFHPCSYIQAPLGATYE